MSRSGERNAENTTKTGTASNNAVNKTAKRQPLEFERVREKMKAPAVGALAVEVSICQPLFVFRSIHQFHSRRLQLAGFSNID